MSASSQRPWYRDGLRFACRQCGNCCTGAPGYVIVTPAELQRIAAFLGQTVNDLTKQNLRDVGGDKSLTEDAASGDCCFLQRNNGQFGCRIYPVRPLQCRTWPFWESNLRSADHWADAAASCPGMNHGPVRDRQYIQSCRNAESLEDLPSCPAS